MTKTATTANPLKLHHSVVKKATRLGVEFVRASDGGFQFAQDGKLSLESWDSTSEAFEDLEGGFVSFEAPRNPSSLNRCGVMTKSYHDRYTKNPKGPGCNDDVDVEMRDYCTVISEGDKTPHLDLNLLRQIGEDAGLWRNKWNGLNPGMQRMNLANRIRGLLRNDPHATIRIGEVVGRFGVEAKETV